MRKLLRKFLDHYGNTEKGVAENTDFWKKGMFPMKKKWPIFLVLSSVVNLKGQFIKLHEVFCHLFWSYMTIYVTPKRLLKAQISEKKSTFPVKKIN